MFAGGGLETIALAVAHLENRGETESSDSTVSEDDDSTSPPSATTITRNTPTPPPPKTVMVPPLPLRSKMNARVVTQEEPVVAEVVVEQAPSDRQKPSVVPDQRFRDIGVVPAATAVPIKSNPSTTEMEYMLFSLDLKELKTLTGPGQNEVISTVREADVLCGRGGETNHHVGNIQYRQFVKACQPAYIEAKRRDKPFIAKRVVLAVRRLGGRFLKKDRETNTWRDVGNAKAREKTSQALREGAPFLTQQMKEPGVAENAKVQGSSKRPLVPSMIGISLDQASKKQRVLEQQHQIEMAHHAAAAAAAQAEISPRPSMLLPTMQAAASVTPPAAYYHPHHHAHAAAAMAAAHHAAVAEAAKRHAAAAAAAAHQAAAHHARVVAASAATAAAPMSFAATVSADDDDRSQQSSSSSQGGKSSSGARGPRLKLFKKRLESDGGKGTVS